VWLVVTVLRRTVYFLRTGYVQTGERVNPDFPDANFKTTSRSTTSWSNLRKIKMCSPLAAGRATAPRISKVSRKTIVGIDISKRAIRFAHKRYPETQTLVMDAHSLGLQPQSVDLVVSTENFEHLTDQEKSLKEVVRVLRPGGVCFIATPNHDISTRANPYHTHEFTASELKALLSGYFGEMEVWPSVLQSPDPASLVLPTRELTVFGLPVDVTYLSNTYSLFSFSRSPK
jgi:SAM-dependent methyltransferase